MSPVSVDGFTVLPVFGTNIVLLPPVVLFDVNFCGSDTLGVVLPVGGDFVAESQFSWEFVCVLIFCCGLPIYAQDHKEYGGSNLFKITQFGTQTY